MHKDRKKNNISSTYLNEYFAGDYGVKPTLWRIRFVLRNIVNNLLPFKRSSYKALQFSIRYDKLSVKYRNQPSPSRWYCLKYLEMNLPYINNMLDIGCGQGDYYNYVTEIIGKDINYKGLDVFQSPSWNNIQNTNVQFEKFDLINQDPFAIYKQYEVIFSQSVLEHIPNDISIFRESINNLVNSSQAKVVIHFIPAASTLITYPFHGYRQYTIKSINKMLAGIDRKNLIIKINTLGGLADYILHLILITLPESIFGRFGFSFREKYPNLYMNLLEYSVNSNYLLRGLKINQLFASFYVIEVRKK